MGFANLTKLMKEIAIVGGGAAGMMAAATLAEGNKPARVTVLERNKDLGRKVKISGGGRCNVTTGVQDLKEILKAYPRGAKFFRTALYDFPPEKVVDWFEQHGVGLKTEKDMRVFPMSDNGDDVVGVFEKVFVEQKVDVKFGYSVSSIEKRDDKFLINGELKFDAIILALGGQAYRHTGSQGDGYGLAESLGHSITDLGPSLNSFMVDDQWVKDLSGVSFADVKLKMCGQEFRGPIIFTHKGISGPATFALSSLCAFDKISKNEAQGLRIDFCPDESYDNLRKQLISSAQNVGKVAAKFATKSFVAKISEQFGMDLNRKANELSKKDMNRLIEVLKNAEIKVVGRLPGDEFVTAGGIELKEIDSKTMQSRICPGLYFAGEIMNIDGFTGGYNLQVAWATGRLAGKNILRS